MTDSHEVAPSCPLPLSDLPEIQMGHGGGGRLTRALIEGLFMPAFANPILETRHDGAVVDLGSVRLAMTTDSYVVTPAFFPGGDIGRLAVTGTVNDLAMCGAEPLYMTAGLILEEGFPTADLARVVSSMRDAAAEAGIALVAGDTKVVGRGAGDGIYINTTGIGRVTTPHPVLPGRITPGDAILLSGDLGRHGIAVMAAREGLDFGGALESDCQALWRPVEALIAAGLDLRCMRDLTRGGLATALIEIAEAAGRPITIRESAVAVSDPVRGAAEILGLDPFYIANEGRFVVIVPNAEAARACEILAAHATGAPPAIIGEVREGGPGRVALETAIGGVRALDLLSGEELPRIC